MKIKYLLHHLGLGDHIICNGMVRNFCEQNDQINLFCYSQYYENLKHMFRDLKNLVLLNFETESHIHDFIHRNDLYPNLIKIGYQNLFPLLHENTSFDVVFYELAKMDFETRFSKFFFERDFQREEKLIKFLNPTNEPYIFVHDDPERNFVINVKSKFKIIKNDKRFLLFDYLGLLENANEIHLMQSSFRDLLNSYKISKPRIYQHNYVRNYSRSLFSVGLNHIEDINYPERI